MENLHWKSLLGEIQRVCERKGPGPAPLVLTQKLLQREGMLRLARGWGAVAARAVDNPRILSAHGAWPYHGSCPSPCGVSWAGAQHVQV